MAEFITVGKVAAPFGIQGEIKVIPLTDFPERFSRGGSYYLSKQKMFKEVEIQGVKIRGREIIIKFEGIDTPEDARVYRNALLQVPRGRCYRFLRVIIIIIKLWGFWLQLRTEPSWAR